MSSTTIELIEAPAHSLYGTSNFAGKPTRIEAGLLDTSSTHALGTSKSQNSRNLPQGDNTQDVISPLPAPTTVSQPLERWNYPRSNIPRVFAAFWSLMVLGMNDAAYGAIIPYMGPYYNLSYTLVSLIFLSPFVGYTLSAILNNWIHTHFGQRGIAIICSTCHLVAYTVAVTHPPYPVLVLVYMLAGFGNGIADAAWNVSARQLHPFPLTVQITRNASVPHDFLNFSLTPITQHRFGWGPWLMPMKCSASCMLSTV